MLDLMGFKKEFISQCRSTLCRSGPSDIEIVERQVNKAQYGKLNGLMFRKEGLNCAPVLYIEDYYLAYQAGNSIKHLSQSAVDTVINSIETADMLSRETENMLGDPQRSLRVRLIERSRNKEYLEGIPSKDAGCGFVFIAEIDCGEYRTVITDDLLQDYDMTEEELFDTAIMNTAEQYPAVLRDLQTAAMGDPYDSINLLDLPDGMLPYEAGPGFVLTNSRLYWGACTLFYPGMIERIYDLLGGDYYVLPSSVHELILITAEGQDPQQLTDMVRSANRSVVERDEILADDLYICKVGKLSRVSYGGIIPPYGESIN